MFGPMVALLLCSGLDINATDHRGMTCLHSAAKQATPSFLSALLKRGADPSKVATGKQTVFHFAAYNHDSEAWRVLLHSMPNPFPLICKTSKAGVTPLQLCCILGNAAGVSECGKFFVPPLPIIDMSTTSLASVLKKSSPSSSNNLPSILLTDALRKKPTKAFLTTLFQKKPQAEIADVLNKPRRGMSKQRWPEGGSWLHYCAHNSAESSIQALTHFGAKSFVDCTGFLPLHYTLHRSLPSASSAIAVSMGTDSWSVRDSKGRSLLHWIACFAAPPPSFNANSGSISLTSTIWNSFWHQIATSRIIRAEIDKSELNSSSNSKNFDNLTLHSSGSGTNSKQNSSFNSLSHHQTILAFLCSAPKLSDPDSRGHRPIHLLAMRDIDGYGLDFLCQNTPSAQLWSRNKKKRNVLHLAAQNRSSRALQVLLNHLKACESKNGVKISDIVNQRDFQGRSPLHLASKAGDAPCIQLLIDAGAQSSLKDKKQQTPIILAARAKSLMVLVQFIDNGLCTIEQARSELTSAGFRSSIPELESLKVRVDLALADSVSLFVPPIDPPAINLAAPASALAIDLRLDIATSLTYDVREGERYPLYNRRCGSAPTGEMLSMTPGRTSPRNNAPQPLHAMTTSASAPNWSSSAPRSPTFARNKGPSSPKTRPNTLASSDDGTLMVRDASFGSAHSTTSSEDLQEFVGSPAGSTVLSHTQSLYINLDHLSRSKISRSISTSPPRSPVGSVINPWGPASPTSAPLSPHLSPRSMSPSTAGAGGRSTPPNTPNSSSFDRMKLHRSLSPRSLPTIKETAGSAHKDSPTKEPSTKSSTGRRQRSDSNTSLAKKTLMMRSRSLTKLPTNIGEDFLEQIKINQSPAYGGTTTHRSAFSLHPGSLDQHYGSVLGHVKSHSDHSQDETPAPKTSSSPKKRHKSQDKAQLQGKKASRGSPSSPSPLELS